MIIPPIKSVNLLASQLPLSVSIALRVIGATTDMDLKIRIKSLFRDRTFDF